MAIDANTGQVLHASSADARRYPASLTKMMTLYLIFEQMEAGKMNGRTKIKISQEAASVAPSKLDLEPGEVISLDEAIKALVTKSANDIAVALAEHVGGTERNFARLMTNKARQIGMKNTTFRNASGLPDNDQVTTARDMLTLALRLMDDFPRQYAVFSTRSFAFNGTTYRNHNALLFSFQGTDGIKTGYTRASGFNLASSVRKNGRHVVAVVFGGNSAAARNVYMRALLQRSLAQAKTEKTRRPMLVASVPSPKPAVRRQLATAQPETLPWAKQAPPSKAQAGKAPLAAPPRPMAPPHQAENPAATPDPAPVRVDIAKVRRVMVPTRPRNTRNGTSPAKQIAPDLETTEEPPRIAATAPPQPQPAYQQRPHQAVPPPPASNTRQALGGPARAPSALNAQITGHNAPPSHQRHIEQGTRATGYGSHRTALTGGVVRGMPPSTLDRQAQALMTGSTPPAYQTAALAPVPPPRAPTPNSYNYSNTHAGTHTRAPGSFQIQVGAYADPMEASRALNAIAQRAPDIVGGRNPVAIPVQKGARQLYRARFAGFNSRDAASACTALRSRQIDCFVMRAE